MEKRILNPDTLMKPSGYVHGILTSGGALLTLAGQTGTNAAGRIEAPGDIVAQFAQALSNLNEVISEAGGKMTDIVKLTIFTTDKLAYRANLKQLGVVYRGLMGPYYPAVTLVEVKSLFDDQALVEIEALAVIPEAEACTNGGR